MKKIDQEMINNQDKAANECVARPTCGIADATITQEGLERAQNCQAYKLPIELLDKSTAAQDDEADNRARIADAIKKKLAVFNIKIELADVAVGPAVTRFVFDVLSPCTRVGEIARYSNDIRALAETCEDVRVVAPLPGSRRVGVEVANRVKRNVLLRDVLDSDEFQKSEGKLVFAIGQSVDGKAVVADLAELPHILITGMAGSGKSMALNSLIVSLMYRYSPGYVRFVMADPKFAELSRYNGMPHLLTEEALTSNADVLAAMDYLSDEMEARYELFRQKGVYNICQYNSDITSSASRLPFLVFIVDELSDLMSANRHAFECKLTRLAQRSRAAGIHIVLATQRSDVQTITGTIKANMPCRMTFKVPSAYDSNTVTGGFGAEKLIGKGDMLFAEPGSTELRVQGSYVTNEEIRRVVEYLRANSEARYDNKIAEKILVSRKQTQGNLCGERYEQYVRFDLKADGKGYRASAHSCRTPAEVVIPTRYHSLPITRISEMGFANCKELVSITIPKGVKSIGEEAFANCDNLTTVNIAVSVASIRDSAFVGCGKLQDVYYDGTQEQWQKIQIDSGNENLINATIHFKQ